MEARSLDSGGVMDFETLAEALPKEMKRVRETIIPVYQRFPSGKLAIWMMEKDLAEAEKATAAQDALAMMRAYEALKGYEL